MLEEVVAEEIEGIAGDLVELLDMMIAGNFDRVEEESGR